MLAILGFTLIILKSSGTIHWPWIICLAPWLFMGAMEVFDRIYWSIEDKKS